AWTQLVLVADVDGLPGAPQLEYDEQTTVAWAACAALQAAGQGIGVPVVSDVFARPSYASDPSLTCPGGLAWGVGPVVIHPLAFALQRLVLATLICPQCPFLDAMPQLLGNP